MSSETPISTQARKIQQKDNSANAVQQCEPEFCVDDDTEEQEYDEEQHLSSNFDHHQDSDSSSSNDNDSRSDPRDDRH